MLTKFTAWAYAHTDKVLHFTACLIICILLCAVTGQWWLGYLLTLSIGALKELLFDANQEDHTADWYDMLANLAGATTGLLLYLIA